ncbi:chitin binding peritrophin-A domain-containing protein [Phthorimaea operculella]|nr:chitin binding peritrophin-A domain-containing protein [Phthorimaea operculella]
MNSATSLLFFLLGAACLMQAHAAAAGDGICLSRNAYYPIDLSCDGYYECKEGQAAEMLCPDGLHFNPRAVWPEYPCSYPMDVICEGERKPRRAGSGDALPGRSPLQPPGGLAGVPLQLPHGCDLRRRTQTPYVSPSVLSLGRAGSGDALPGRSPLQPPGGLAGVPLQLPHGCDLRRRTQTPYEEQAAEMLCPDGLHFNPRAVWPEYPCSYPMDVICEGDRKPRRAGSGDALPGRSPLQPPGGLAGVPLQLPHGCDLRRRTQTPYVSPSVLSLGRAGSGDALPGRSPLQPPGGLAGVPLQLPHGCDLRRRTQTPYVSPSVLSLGRAGSGDALPGRSPLQPPGGLAGEGQAAEMLCPDGLHFNPRAVWPEYPCSYPMDVICEGERKPQPAQPTADCPHQFGFFPSPQSSPDNCGQYRMCVDGLAIEMMCPPGLAFNPQNARCDWPDLVSSCKSEEFLNFKCPPAPLGDDGEPLEIVNYKYEGDCFAFYSCEKGHPRLLTCDAGFAFDEALGHCVDATKVNCIQPVGLAAPSEYMYAELYDHIFRDEGDCYPLLLIRDAGFAFDEASGHCVDATKVNCIQPVGLAAPLKI